MALAGGYQGIRKQQWGLRVINLKFRAKWKSQRTWGQKGWGSNPECDLNRVPEIDLSTRQICSTKVKALIEKE